MGEKYVFAWFVGRAAHTPTHTHDTCHTVTRAIYKRGLEHVKAELSKPIVRYHSGVAAAIAYSHTYKCGAHTSTGLSKSSVCTTLVVAALCTRTHISLIRKYEYRKHSKNAAHTYALERGRH